MPDRFDVMLVIDVSDSTKVASGADVDRDGRVGVNPHTELLPPGAVPADVLQHRSRATRSSRRRSPRRARCSRASIRARVRVGLVTFAGEVEPATGERKQHRSAGRLARAAADERLRRACDRALAAILARGPHGATNFAAGSGSAIVELAGSRGARSAPRAERSKVMLFLTDGIPTLPVGKGNREDPGDDEAALRAAQLAHQAGISINTYALGPDGAPVPARGRPRWRA